jgi:hypothetical protein
MEAKIRDVRTRANQENEYKIAPHPRLTHKAMSETSGSVKSEYLTEKKDYFHTKKYGFWIWLFCNKHFQ